RRQFGLPVAMCLGIIAQPAYLDLIQGDLRTDRDQVANYIGEQTKDSDKMYGWDNRASIYLSSHCLSAATMTTAEPYLNP
ncbi:quinol oxidase, partial [Streptococcus suis]